ncbi:MAG TPA: nuclear transport factor 2 family protein [Chitinophagaceae bacterium]|nr:nuclear transport factor 2 family protein [Chitinophagaceae bacterium]
MDLINMAPGQIVTRQIEAYSNRDIEANMVLFSDDVKMVRFSDGHILIDGKEACREMYHQLFKNSPDLFAEVINRIDFDNKIILHEYVQGRNGSSEKTAQLIIFEIVNNKIAKIYRL